jgi:hypothetical protein
MVERVAAAIHDKRRSDDPQDMLGAMLWDYFGGAMPDQAGVRAQVHDFCRTLARAAIEAMREPTPRMEAAGFSSLHDVQSPHGSPDGCWIAMIDAALQKEPT